MRFITNNIPLQGLRNITIAVSTQLYAVMCARQSIKNLLKGVGMKIAEMRGRHNLIPHRCNFLNFSVSLSSFYCDF